MITLILFAIVLSIVLGYTTKINIGIYAIIFTYIIGCYVANLKPSEIISFWPTKIFFIIFSVTLFYNFAMANGALENLANKLLYSCRKIPFLLPLVIFLVSTLIAGFGAGFYTVLAFMAPITLLLCQKTKMSLVIGGMAVNYGALAGANFMTSQSGIIFRGVLETIQIPADVAFSYSTHIFIVTLLIPIIIIGGYVLLTGHKKKLHLDIEKANTLSQKQRISIFLILFMLAIVLIVPIMHLLLPGNSTISILNKKIDISFIAIIFSLISLLLKLSDEKKVVAMIPWNSLILICGMGMLIGLGVKVGVINAISHWISDNVNELYIPIVIMLISALMSIFSSTLGVVVPTMFPIVPVLSSMTGIPAGLLFTCIVVGAQSTAISPFSPGGSLILGSSPDSINKTNLFNDILFKAIPIGLIAAIIAVVLLQITY